MGSQHTAVKRDPLAQTRGSPCSAVKTKCRGSWTLSPGFLPSYSAPSLQEWGPPVPLGHRPWRWGVQRISRTPAAPHPSCTSSKGTLGWAEPHPRFPRCARYMSHSEASGNISLSGQNLAGLSEFQCLWRQGQEQRAQCFPLKGLQGPFLPWRKVPVGSHPLSPGLSLLGPRTTVGRLALVDRRPPPSWAQPLQKLPGLLVTTAVSAPWGILWTPGEPQFLIPKLPPGPWALPTPGDFPELMDQKTFPQTFLRSSPWEKGGLSYHQPLEAGVWDLAAPRVGSPVPWLILLATLFCPGGFREVGLSMVCCRRRDAPHWA